MSQAQYCPFCGAFAQFNNVWNGQSPEFVHIVMICQHCSRMVWAMNQGGKEVILYPVSKLTAPDEYPEDVRDNFTEALRSLAHGNYKSAVVMARTALQASTRGMNAKGTNLKQEIEDLASRHVIPKSLEDWAHSIRDGGNLVAHPE